MKTQHYICRKCGKSIYPAELPPEWDGDCYHCGSSDLDYQGLVDNSDALGKIIFEN